MIYHITEATTWDSALRNGFYATQSIATEGFIHASQLNQIQGALERYYIGVSNLIILAIDETKCTPTVKFELAPNVGEQFPHIYGKLNIDAVTAVYAVFTDAGGNNTYLI
jgi:uncharacterized protein (DUF952 family)